MLPMQAGYPVCFNVQCAMCNVQCTMCNDYFLRERRVTVTQLHTPHCLCAIRLADVWENNSVPADTVCINRDVV